MTLVDMLLNQPSPLAHLLLADPDAPSPVPEGWTMHSIVPIIVADTVAEVGVQCPTTLLGRWETWG
jgi:hypothetical protein